MFQVSDRFKAKLNETHEVVCRLEISHGHESEFVDIIGGSVIQDADAPTRRAMGCDLVFDDSESYDDIYALLEPSTATLRPWRGIRFEDDTEELVPLGVFFQDKPVEIVTQNGGGRVWRLSAYDASGLCQRPLSRPFSIPAGTTLNDMVAQLLLTRVPTMTFRLAESEFTAPSLLLLPGDDVWEKATDLMFAAGWELGMSRDGVCESVHRPIAPVANAVWSYVEGPGCQFNNPTRAKGAPTAPNVVRVIGQHSSTAGVAGEAADMDPASDTYRYGKGGERVMTITSTKITSDNQATQMAGVTLAQELGKEDEVTLAVIPNPALDLFDTIAVTKLGFGLDAKRMLLNRSECPLTTGTSGTANSMSVTLRRGVRIDAEGTPGRQ